MRVIDIPKATKIPTTPTILIMVKRDAFSLGGEGLEEESDVRISRYTTTPMIIMMINFSPMSMVVSLLVYVFHKRSS
jgi:hypothetical protein